MVEAVRPDTACINIEIAHLRSWDSPEAQSSAEESLLIADEYRLAVQDRPPQTALSILVDDKVLQIKDRAKWLRQAGERWPHILSRVDFFCFESDLATIADAFITLLVSSKRGRRAREIERYRDKHGRVACSHDIAIWHSLRLGLLGRHDKLIQSGPHWTERANFYCSRVVSILEEENREEEARATEILRESSGAPHLHVETIFYAP